MWTIHSMSTDLLLGDVVKQMILSARERFDSSEPGETFAAKIRPTKSSTAKTEEFNVWHAASDNVTESGANAARKRSPTRLADEG